MSVLKIKGSDGQWHGIDSIRGEGVPPITSQDEGKILAVSGNEAKWMPAYVHHYTAVWDQVNAKMTRENDAAWITTDTTNFAHKGTVNPNYNNPFDNIYPWRGRKLCNISVPDYMALSEGESLLNCVSAWEGQPGFSYDDQYGVWVYTPEFWGKSWIENRNGTDYWIFDIADRECPGYIYYRERIEGRWHGSVSNLSGIGECLLPKKGLQSIDSPVNLHEYANNYNASLDNVFSLDAVKLLLLIEYATMDSQFAIGSGASGVSYNGNLKVSNVNGNSVTVVSTQLIQPRLSPGVLIHFSDTTSSHPGNQYDIISVEHGDSESILTFSTTPDVSIGQYWSIWHLANTEDSEIGSKSGYIGVDGRSICYYRGEELFGNYYFYILGSYLAQTNNHFKISISEEDADSHDGNDPVAIDTDIVSPDTGFIESFGRTPSISGILSSPIFPNSTGETASDANPVGDYFYHDSRPNNVMNAGGNTAWESKDGIFCAAFSNDINVGYHNYSARPILMKR